MPKASAPRRPGTQRASRLSRDLIVDPAAARKPKTPAQKPKKGGKARPRAGRC